MGVYLICIFVDLYQFLIIIYDIELNTNLTHKLQIYLKLYKFNRQ